MLQSSLSKYLLPAFGLMILPLPQESGAAVIQIPFKPSNFSHPLQIDNPYFTLKAGMVQVFRAKSDEGCELDRMTITHDTRRLDGVTTRVVHDVVFEDPKCNGDFSKIEDTLDYYAQDDAGNVWYMGEISKDCEDGTCKRNEGTWLAGQDVLDIGENAKPGIVMLAHPTKGAQYRQEFYPGHAVDQAIVTEVDIPVKLTFSDAIPPKSFRDCIKTKEFSNLEPDTVGFKYYCPNVGFVLETEQPGNFRSERVNPDDALRFRTVPG
jgi:hypothetical protein